MADLVNHEIEVKSILKHTCAGWQVPGYGLDH